MATHYSSWGLKEWDMIEYTHIQIRVCVLDMSKEGWPSQKGCKLISKPHPRHTQELTHLLQNNQGVTSPTLAHAP